MTGGNEGARQWRTTLCPVSGTHLLHDVGDSVNEHIRTLHTTLDKTIEALSA